MAPRIGHLTDAPDRVAHTVTVVKIVILTVLLVHPAIPLAQNSIEGDPRFRYVLPEGFSGWACTDFGVEGASPLKLDQGLYVIEPPPDAILRTSSFPALAMPPFPSELIQTVNGQPQRLELTDIQRRGEYDTRYPVARYCLFFGSAAASAKVPRPPTLTESRLGTEPVLKDFEFSKGQLCEFRNVLRLCLVAKDVSGRPIKNDIARALRSVGAAVVTNSCDDFDGIVVRYDGDFAVQTHSSSRGPRFAFAEVRRELPRTGTAALATWSNTEGGSAEAVAERFGRELAAFLRQAVSAECAR